MDTKKLETKLCALSAMVGFAHSQLFIMRQQLKLLDDWTATDEEFYNKFNKAFELYTSDKAFEAFETIMT